MAQAPDTSNSVSAGTATLRALRQRCPNCGEGKLFSSYLKQVERCAVCGEDFAEISPQDAASWLTILVTGILTIPVIAAVELNTHWPVVGSMVAWCGFALAVMLVLLPRVKAFLIGMIWLTRRGGRGA